MSLTARLRLSLLTLAALTAWSSSLAAEPLQAGSAAVPAPRLNKPRSPDLDAEVVFKTLLAEIAAARNQVDLAAYLYSELAEATQDARIARRATEMGLRSGQLDLTGKAARLWADLEPHSSNSLQALALAMSGQYANLDDMEPALRRMLESETLPTETLLLQLRQLLARYPDKQAALEMVERLTQPYLRYAEAHVVRATLALAARDLPKAEREAQKALDIRPDWGVAAVIRAQAAPPERKTASMEELGRFGKRFPQAKEAREEYARWLYQQGRKDEASEVFSRLQADFPNDDDAAFNNVVALLQSGETKRSEELLRRLIERNYRDVDLLRLQLGQLLEKTSRPDEAIAVYREIKPGTNFVPALARAAQLLIQQKKFDEAAGLLADAAVKSPDNVVVFSLAQAELLNKQKQPAAALAVLEKLMASKPDELEVVYQAAMLAEQLKRYDVMEKWLQKVIAASPDNASAFNALGYSYADRNVRLDEADRLLSKAIALAPENPAIMDSVGWLRFRQGKLDSALDLLRKAYALEADADIAAHLGEVLWLRGDKDEARRVINDAAQKNPDNPAIEAVKKRLIK